MEVESHTKDKPSTPDEETLVAVQCGSQHLILVTSKGLYALGRNQEG